MTATLPRPRSPPTSPFPWLFMAALALAAGALVPWRGAPWWTALALLVLAWREGRVLLPFLLAGHLLQPPPAPPPGAPGSEVGAIVRTLGPARETADGRARQPVALRVEGAGRDAAERRGELLLPAYDAALPRARVAATHGRLLPAAAPENPGEAPRPDRFIVAASSRLRPLADDATPLERLLRTIDGWAEAMSARLRSALTPEIAAFTEAVVLGRTAHLEPRLIDALRSTGAWHLLAVSGSHVALVAAGAARLVALAPLPVAVQEALTLATTLLYAAMTGAEAPALRAAITFAGALPLLRRRRAAAPLAWLGAAFLIIALSAPASCREAGTQLSFTAVLALAVAARHGPARSPRGSGRGLDFLGASGRALRFATAAGLATMPLCALHFGTAAPWSPLATLLLAPPVSAAIFLGLAAAALLPVAPVTAHLVAPLLGVLRSTVIAVATQLDRLPATPWNLEVEGGFVVALLFAVWVALLARRAGFALVLAAWAGLATAFDPPLPARFVALSVGHGQVAVQQTPTASPSAGVTSHLFDAGGFALSPTADRRLDHILDALRVGDLATLALSHLDGDHALLAPALLATRPIGALLLAPAAAAEVARATTPIAVALVHGCARSGTPIQRGNAGDILPTGSDEAGSLTIEWPPSGREFAERNASSLVVRSEVRGFVILLPGDLEGVLLAELARRPLAPVDLLLLPHHGNADPGLGALLDATAPRWVLASREDELPDATRRSLARRGIPWLSTARGGAFEVDFLPVTGGDETSATEPVLPGGRVRIRRGDGDDASAPCFLRVGGR